MTMTKVNKKQLKITKLFRKGNKRPRILKENDENSELQQEVAELERKLQEKQNYLFQIQRASYRHPVVVPKRTEDNDVANTKSLIVKHHIDRWQKTLDVTTMLTGMVVESYDRDHCSVIFHMQLDRDMDVKHGVTISEVDGEQKITGSSLPLGFNLKSMLDGCNNEISFKTFDVIRKALTAYYARLEQYEDLKVYLSVDASLFKLMDGTQMEFTFVVRNELEEDSEATESITFILNYTMYDIRPRDYSFKGLSDKPQETLWEQFLLFKKYPLTKAFKLAFIDDEGPYKLVRHVDSPLLESRRNCRKRHRRNANANHANDDTFHVEDCSESSGDEAEDN
ncbi:uncharacterized protein LOC134743263 [Cydia strobilella]|uniref:uncharacterized protein LOC134743263 n=1 Tax=Cydia strobilella TaxID=1100964 RepID=UPI0030076B9C